MILMVDGMVGFVVLMCKGVLFDVVFVVCFELVVWVMGVCLVFELCGVGLLR